MKKSTKKLLQVVFIISLIYLLFRKNKLTERFTNDKKQTLFDNFIGEHFSVIFPNGGRNAGGPQFYEYIVNTLNLDKEHFKLYNQFYCGVSGSPISPNRSGGNITNNIVLEDLNGLEWFGKYYRCCTPCPCDLMRYAKVEKHSVNLSDGLYPHFVITIDDPCSNESEIPQEVSSFVCNNGNTQNGIHTESGRLIIGILFGQNEMEEQPIHYNPENHTIDADQFCSQRICEKPSNLRGGMGDIFVLLSLVGNETIPPAPERFNCPDNIEPLENTQMINIYGENLRPCRNQNNIDDNRGSWDSEGYCSELDGGVHQICFNVDEDTKEFSSQTNQSDWSLNRYGKNHCMCLGAWALYKAKQEQNIIPKTSNELNCDSIPSISLTNNYINTWNQWNGNELPNQIVQGVNQLVEQCYSKGNESQKQYLKEKYLSLVDSRNEFHNTDTYLSFQE